MLYAILFVCEVLAQGPHGDPSRRASPNIVLIHADDLGYGDLSCFGHPTSVTPNIDRMASQGARFTQFYSASPVCSPSRAGLLTGRWPASVGVYCSNSTEACDRPEDTSPGQCCSGVWEPGIPGGVSPNTLNFASVLKTAGYHTMAIGKWHLGGVTPTDEWPISHHPLKFGFDEYFGCPHGLGACPLGNCFCQEENCAIAGNANWTGCPLYANESILTQPADLRTLSEQYSAAAEEFIARLSEKKEKFFLYYASHHVHSPQFAGIDTTNLTLRGRFGDSLAELDTSVGLLIKSLTMHGADSSTIVLFTSDNGPSLRNEVRGGNAGLLRCGKGTTFEGGLRVPLIVQWPERIKPGSIVRDVFASIDLLPTIMEILNLSTQNAHMDGYASASLVLENGQSPRNGRYVYFPQFPQRNRGIMGGIYAARAGKWKVHWCIQGSLQCGINNSDSKCGPSQPYEVLEAPLVFNIEEDPSEQYPFSPADAEYQIGLLAATQVAKEHEESFKWFQSPQLNVGRFDHRLQPCCNPGCQPWPSCCNCNHNPHLPEPCVTPNNTIIKPWDWNLLESSNSIQLRSP